MRRATIKRVDAGAIHIKGPQREEADDNKESGCRGHTNQVPAGGGEGRQYRERVHRLYKPRACRGRIRATINSADVETILIKGPPRDEKSVNEGGGCRGYTNQEPAEGGEGPQRV